MKTETGREKESAERERERERKGYTERENFLSSSCPVLVQFNSVLVQLQSSFGLILVLL